MMIKVKAEDAIRTFAYNNSGKIDFPYFTIGRCSYINEMKIHLTEGNEVINIQIGNYCSIAYNVQLLVDRNHDYKSVSTSPFLEISRKIPKKGQVIVGHDVWIGNNATILSGVSIGSGAVIAANAVVTKDVPPYAIVGGNPARVIRYRFEPDQIEMLLTMQWWNWDSSFIEEKKPFFGLDIDQFITAFQNDNEKVESEEIALVAKGTRVLFIPDFNDPYPVWKEVLKQYMLGYNSNDDISLLLRIANGMDFNRNLTLLDQELEQLLHENCPDLLVINDDLQSEESLFPIVDYFITTRNSEMMKYIDYANQHQVKILSGVDLPVFK